MIRFPARVVVVDDQEEDARPMLAALNREGTPALHYTGNPAELPAIPLEGVRVVFLDIRIYGMEAQPFKTVLSALVGVMKALVGETNGPYVVIIWTKHPEEFEEVAGKLKDLPCPPLLTLRLTKQECRTQDDGGFDMDKIRDGIKSRLAELGAAGLLLRWEELVRSAAGKVAHEICSIPGPVPANAAVLLHKLASATAGKPAQNFSGSDLAKEALCAMGGMLSDTLDREIRLADDLDLKPLAAPPDGEAGKLNARLNAKLLLAAKPEAGTRPGTMFSLREKDTTVFHKRLLKRMLPRGLHTALDEHEPETYTVPPTVIPAVSSAGRPPEADSSPQSVKPKSEAENNAEIVKRLLDPKLAFSVVLTPYCDYGQHKLLRPQVCSGILWPANMKKCLQKADFLYDSPAVHPEGAAEAFIVVVDLGSIGSCEPEELTLPIMALRRELVLDIQNDLGRHLSRPGLVTVS